MDETFARVTFDATIDELVDVNLRHYATSVEFRRSHRNAMLGGGATVAIGVLVVASPLWKAEHGVAIVSATILILGALIGFLSGRAYDDSNKKRVRRYIAEQLRGSQSLRCEVELRSSGLWIRQDDAEHLYRWGDVTSVDDTSISVDIVARNIILVVRNRAFSGLEERGSFIEHARRLASPAVSEDPR
jgi:hypothetical protein